MSKIKSNTAAAKSTEAVEVAPKAKVVQNPANATARTTYEPVVHSTGTIAGKPARLAWYGTKYGCIEIEQADGSFVVHHDTAFGGMRSVDALEGLFDSVAPVVVTLAAETVVSEVALDAGTPVADVLVLGGDMREIQLTAGNVAVVVELDPVDFAKAEANIAATFPAPVVAAEPVYTTLDEVRAAHEAETRGACRASVLRALRVRAGEIALGVVAGGKAEKVKAEREASDGTLAKHMSLPEMVSAKIVKIGDLLQCRGSDITIAVCEGGTVTGNLTLNQWATSILVGRKFNAYTNVIHVATGKTLAQLRPE